MLLLYFAIYSAKKISKERRKNMKKNKYLKAKLSMSNEEECLYNTFAIYVAGILELLLVAILQGELNLVSILCIIFAATALCSCSYQIGKNSALKSVQDMQE